MDYLSDVSLLHSLRQRSLTGIHGEFIFGSISSIFKISENQNPSSHTLHTPPTLPILQFYLDHTSQISTAKAQPSLTSHNSQKHHASPLATVASTTTPSSLPPPTKKAGSRLSTLLPPLSQPQLERKERTAPELSGEHITTPSLISCGPGATPPCSPLLETNPSACLTLHTQNP